MTRARIQRLEDLPLQCVRPLAGLDIDRLRSEAQAAGHRTVAVDLAACGDRTAVLRALGRALALPSWFGANLDALYDALTDDDQFRVGSGALVVLDALPGSDVERGALLDVFRDAAEHRAGMGAAFRVLYR